jgi:hypothetical protein
MPPELSSKEHGQREPGSTDDSADAVGVIADRHCDSVADRGSPVGWLLAKPLGLGTTGVFVGVLVGFSTMAIGATVLFRRGAWKRATV